MTRRAAPIFRGSELPRLLILAAIALAGWPLVLLFAQSKDAPRPAPPPAVPAAAIAPVEPDAGVEFQAVVDKAPMKGRENAAYAILLDRARQTTPADLAAASPPRRPVHPPLGAPASATAACRSTSRGPPSAS